jgi:hypothetical protein
MDACIFNSQSAFITAVQAAAREAAPSAPESRAAQLLASAVQLSELCTVCFWASLEVEEGREVRGTLCICSPEQVQLARSFTLPVPLTVKNLVALLTASPRSPLAVHGGPEGLAVWGLLDAEPEDLPRLRLAGNGILLASRARQVLAILNHGVMSIPVASDEESLAQLVARTLGKERALEQRGNMPGKLIRVVTTMIRHGHGGGLLLVPPEDQSWRSSVTMRFCFDEHSANVLHDSLVNFEADMAEATRGYEDLIAGRGSCDSILALRERYDAAVFLRTLSDTLFRRVGDLSLIDGVVVMDMELRLHGFGAKLLFGPEAIWVSTLNAVTGSVRSGVALADLGGMRHQSAARFVAVNRGCDVFVVSQDGRLSMFSWSAKTESVAVVQNLEHFLWEYRGF